MHAHCILAHVTHIILPTCKIHENLFTMKTYGIILLWWHTHTRTRTHTHTLSSSHIGMEAVLPLLHRPESSHPTHHTPHTRHSWLLPLALPWLPSNTLQDVHSDWNLGHWGPFGGCEKSRKESIRWYQHLQSSEDSFKWAPSLFYMCGQWFANNWGPRWKCACAESHIHRMSPEVLKPQRTCYWPLCCEWIVHRPMVAVLQSLSVSRDIM